VIDEIIPEPPGGAHSDPEAAAAALATRCSGISVSCAGSRPTSSSNGAKKSTFHGCPTEKCNWTSVLEVRFKGTGANTYLPSKTPPRSPDVPSS